jgi:single-strand DNA-binding protein
MFETYTTIVGTLITQVGRRRLADGTTVVNFRLASNERRYDKGTGSWRDGDTLYVGVSAWRQLAESVHASLAIGDPIMVRGRLYTRSYEKDGRQNWITELEADAVGPDLARCTAVVTRTSRRAEAPALDAASEPSAVGTADDPDAHEDDWLTDLAEPDGGGAGRAPSDRLGAARPTVEAAVGA